MGSLKPKNFLFQAFFAFIEPLMSVFAFGFSSPHRKNRYKIDFFHQFFKIRRFCIKIWRKPDLFFISPRKSIFPALKTDFFSKLWNSTPTENCCNFFFPLQRHFSLKKYPKIKNFCCLLKTIKNRNSPKIINECWNVRIFPLLFVSTEEKGHTQKRHEK